MSNRARFLAVRERIIANGQAKRDETQLHADAVIRRYVDAVRERYGDERAASINATYDNGWYHVNGKALREDALTLAANFMYASAHEQQMGETNEA